MENSSNFEIKVAKILNDIVTNEIDATSLTPQTDLINDIGLNSLDLLQFIVSAEREFEIEIDIESLDLRCFNQLSLMKTYIENTVEKQKAG